MSNERPEYTLGCQINLEHADPAGNPAFVMVGSRNAVRFGEERLAVLYVGANESGVMTLHLTKGEARRIAHLLLAEAS